MHDISYVATLHLRMLCDRIAVSSFDTHAGVRPFRSRGLALAAATRLNTAGTDVQIRPQVNNLKVGGTSRVIDFYKVPVNFEST
jgi:hypothetical protein